MVIIPVKKKLTISHDLLRPRASIELKYTGKNPERIYTEIPHLLATIFKIHEGAVQEKNINVIKGEPERLKCTWEMIKELDAYSFYFIAINFSAKFSKDHGDVNITIDGSLRTEYPQETFWERSIVYEFMRMLWHRFFYEQKRHEYYAEGQRLLAHFITEIKRMFHGMG